MFSYNSLGQAVKTGVPLKNGQIVYWYNMDGTAKPRKFVFQNTIKFPVSFRVTMQTMSQMIDLGVLGIS
jgi:hypothetical protein